MTNYFTERYKKLGTLALISIIISIVIDLYLPSWWYNANVNEFSAWYPSFGYLVYGFFKYVAPLYFYCCFIILILLLRNYILHILKLSFSRLKYLYTKISTYFTEDTLNERRFVSGLFFKALSLCYLVAFSSLLWQFPLISENGLIPYKEFASITLQKDGWTSIFTYPSIFWIIQSNWFIIFILSLSIIISILGVFGKHKTLSFFTLWFFYLSVVTFGRDLFIFPWDTFLLEIGFISTIISFFIQKLNQLPRILLFTILLLFFRQWFSMAMTKMLFSDPTWMNLTYMKYFWLNQPSPTPIAWYSYQLPMTVQKILTLITLIGELLIPLVLLFGRRGRLLSFFISLLFSLMIELNGNYGFFNLITAVLGIWCLDDQFFKKKWIPKSSLKIGNKSKTIKISLLSVVITVIIFNFFYITNLFIRQNNHANFLNYQLISTEKYSKLSFEYYFFKVGGIFSHFRIVAPHGVFKGIPKLRLQMDIQVKVEGQNWQKLTPKIGKEIEDFSFSAPFMNRVNYLMYYQANGIWGRNYFFTFIEKINPNTYYFDSWLKKMIIGVFENNNEIDKLMSYSIKGKVYKIKILCKHMNIYEQSTQPFSKFNSKNKVLIEKTIIRNREFSTPFYTIKEVVTSIDKERKYYSDINAKQLDP